MKIEDMNHNEIKEQEPIKTNWVVIIGPPSSGKTTTFEHLAPQLKTQGFTPVPEVERAIIEEDQKKGIVRRNTPEYAMALEHRFLEARDQIERSLDPNTKVIMDRGLPDIIAYARFYKADESFAQGPAKRIKYRQIFYLEPLVNYEQDQTRVEDPEFAIWMHENLPKVYEELGYEIVRVPVSPYGQKSYESEEDKRKDSLDQRSRFIIDNISKEGPPSREASAGEGGEEL